MVLAHVTPLYGEPHVFNPSWNLDQTRLLTRLILNGTIRSSAVPTRHASNVKLRVHSSSPRLRPPVAPFGETTPDASLTGEIASCSGKLCWRAYISSLSAMMPLHIRILFG